MDLREEAYMSYDEREGQANLLESLADDLTTGDDFLRFFNTFERTPSQLECVSLWLRNRADKIRNPEPRRRRGERSAAPRNIPEQEQAPWPPDPYWGVDQHGRFIYTDYDGESLVVRADREGDGSLWFDKGGQGPVFVRAEDVSVIVAGIWGRLP